MAGRKRSDLDDTLPQWDPSEAATTLPEGTPAPDRKTLFEDDRPTELFDGDLKASLHTSREQLIRGSTIADMIENAAHQLSRPLAQLVARAKADLPSARIDDKASLRLRHEFEFDRRIGYQLRLELFGARGQCVEVQAEVDHDGHEVRRGSMMSKLLQI